MADSPTQQECLLDLSNEAHEPHTMHESPRPNDKVGEISPHRSAGFTLADFARLIPRPSPCAHKYSRGIAHIVGGSASYPGAATLAASAAQRMGAGYTQVWCAPESVHDIRAGHPSLVVRPWDADSVKAAFERDRSRKAAVLIGPGFEPEGEGSALLGIALESGLPLVIDGGALGMLAALHKTEATRVLVERSSQGIPTILTPHAGEAAALCRVAGIQASEREAQALELSAAYQATVALKGPDTLVARAKRLYLMDAGTPALAKAGTGDVLAGIVCALLAQGLDPFDAASLGAYLHAKAGSHAAAELTDVCVIPEDVIAHLPFAIAQLLDTHLR